MSSRVEVSCHWVNQMKPITEIVVHAIGKYEISIKIEKDETIKVEDPRKATTPVRTRQMLGRRVEASSRLTGDEPVEQLFKCHFAKVLVPVCLNSHRQLRDA